MLDSLVAKRFRLVTLMAVVMAVLAAAPARGEKKVEKTVIILAAFGTTYELDADPLKETSDLIKKRHPGVDVMVGYTSAFVAKTLKSRGKDAPTLAEALASAAARGYSRVLVQSMHVVPGEEYDMVRQTVRAFTGLPKGIRESVVGAPLMADTGDVTRLASILTMNLPKERKSTDAVVYVGHGSPGPGGLAYPALQAELSAFDSNALVGVVEFGPDAESVVQKLKAMKIKKVWLVPLLTVLGDHGQNDLFGDEDDSWKKTIEKAGITVEPVKVGLAFQPGVAEIWADHLDRAVSPPEHE